MPDWRDLRRAAAVPQRSGNPGRAESGPNHQRGSHLFDASQLHGYLVQGSKMKDAKKIAASIRSAIAAANIYSPGAIREAMAHVRSWQEDDPAEQAVVNAFV